MELQWNKTPCPYLHTQIRQVQTLEETQELRLPEELPDIGRVLCAWGQCVVRGKQWRGDGMQASGGVTVSVLYLPEDGSVARCVESWLPFQAKWSFPQTRREGAMRIATLLQGVDARTLSARKMMLRANISLLGEALEPTEAEIYAPAELPTGIEVLANVYPAVLPREAGEKQFTIEDEIHIPGVSKWVSFSMQPEVTEQNVVGSRVVIRGNGHLRYVYLDEQGEIRSGNLDIPFAQFADLDRDYDNEATADLMLCVSGMEPETGEDSLHIQCSVTAQYLIKDRALLEIIEDAYSPTRELSLEIQTLKLPMELENRVEVLDADPVFQEGKVLDMMFLPEYPVQYRDGDMVNLEIPAQFRFLYQDPEGNLQSATENWSTTLTVPAAENTQLQPTITSIEPSSNSARMKLNLQTWADQQIPMISGLTVGGSKPLEEARPSLILRPMDTDSLWELAKETGSTMDAIRKANGLTQEPRQGQMLLIPVT
jgi:hypothetical protein